MEYYEAMVGDGESTTFYFTFPFFGVNDIHVKVNDVEQTNYIMTPNPTPNDADTEYTGGTVEFLTAPANGDRITIYREIELVRHIDYQPTKKPEYKLTRAKTIEHKIKKHTGFGNNSNIGGFIGGINNNT